mmetsp:Transcript_25661/g.38359  ORF Transcript_25661/g.38359 Transcript_25661/m.38359 type:complete len:336 (-) Transcript_25661:1007-2014(-)|eukprot:CAMPEP_0116008548 /NCGR_PEP_ID=MMETSP0321-20121206/2920_1 /TAXON_ID=163516 /ORGANISM="Leptocylindrus danicus var. danicus, Strain B650" /LENGTH=335 /DNA_ID=CAMNT_0003477375 /DNA_START=58 /DNA_END=1065 /DNA_ORIENTATION=-
MPTLMDRIIDPSEDHDGSAKRIPDDCGIHINPTASTTDSSTANENEEMEEHHHHHQRPTKCIKRKPCWSSRFNYSRGKRLHIPSTVKHDSPTSTVVQIEMISKFDNLFLSQQQLQLSDLIGAANDGLNVLNAAIEQLDGMAASVPRLDDIGRKIYTASSKQLASKAMKLLRIVSNNLDMSRRRVNDHEILNRHDCERVLAVLHSCISKVMELIVAMTKKTKVLGQRSDFIKNSLYEDGVYHGGTEQRNKTNHRINQILDEMDVSCQAELESAGVDTKDTTVEEGDGLISEQTKERLREVHYMDESYARLLADQYSLLAELRDYTNHPNDPKTASI